MAAVATSCSMSKWILTTILLASLVDHSLQVKSCWFCDAPTLKECLSSMVKDDCDAGWGFAPEYAICGTSWLKGGHIIKACDTMKRWKTPYGNKIGCWNWKVEGNEGDSICYCNEDNCNTHKPLGFNKSYSIWNPDFDLPGPFDDDYDD